MIYMKVICWIYRRTRLDRVNIDVIKEKIRVTSIENETKKSYTRDGLEISRERNLMHG